MIGCSTEEILSRTERPYYICLSIGDYQKVILDRYRKYYKFYYYNEAIEEEEKKLNAESLSQKLTLFIK
jgi:23S rRNA G2069 N7-methylase RlmK/C1962 C5-methylase RlmI